MTVGQNAPTSPIAALREQLARQDERIGNLERHHHKPILGNDHEEGPSNISDSLKVFATVDLEIPITWSSGWNYYTVGLLLCRPNGTPSGNRQCTIRIRRGTAVAAGTMVTLDQNRRELYTQTHMNKSLSVTGTQTFDISAELTSNDNYEVADATIWVVAGRNS